MRFDICLMNPPYDKNLHLKFLEKTIQVADTVISIQPIIWLQNQNAKDNKTSNYNKYKDSISKYINSLEVIEGKTGWKKYFGIDGTGDDFGIYKCNDVGGFDYDSVVWSKLNKAAYDTFSNKTKVFPQLEQYNESTDKAFVPIKTYANDHRNTRYNIVTPNTYKIIYKQKTPDGDKWNNKTYKSKSLVKSLPMGLYFNTYGEAVNFYNSCLTEAYKYIVSVFKQGGGVPLKNIPYFDDYTKEWDNSRIFTYFKIPKNEWQDIIDSMQPFMNNSDKL